MPDDQTAALLPDGFRDEFEAAPTPRGQWKTVARYFRVEPVRTNHDILPGLLYFVFADETHLIVSGGEKRNVDPVPMTVVLTGQRMRPVPRKKLFELGRNSQLFKLTRRKAPLGDPSALLGDSAANKSSKMHAGTMLEMGSFTQLLAVAQQTGIVPAADQIAHVRDCEFRMGDYQIAFECIERLYVGFKQSADARVQRLRREEIDYKSGVLKMSPKEWQKKKHRDTVQTNIIERARRNFIRVLDGLRVLMLSKS